MQSRPSVLAQVLRCDGYRARKMMEIRKVRRKCAMLRVTTVIAVRRDGGWWGGSWEVCVVVVVVVPGRGVNARKRRVLLCIRPVSP